MQGKLFKQKIASRILSEANDLKRTVDSLSIELSIDKKELVEILEGHKSLDDLYRIIDKMEKIYPIDGCDLKLVEDDCTHGAKIMRAQDSFESRRTVKKVNRTGELAPYYEYRDTVCSRLSPFRPEWIKMNRVVDDCDPENPDVVLNKGHFLHQYTFYVGAINFYWNINGQRFCKRMNTGDSSYGTPWWPHAFATRNASEPAYILATTFEGDTRRAQKELYALGSRAKEFALDSRFNRRAIAQLIRQHMDREMLSDSLLQQKLRNQNSTLMVDQIFDFSNTLDNDDIVTLAACLNVEPQDLSMPTFGPDDEVITKHMNLSEEEHYPSLDEAAYRIQRTARLTRMPLMKGFSIETLSKQFNEQSTIRHSLHTWAYNYSDHPAELRWSDGKETLDTIMEPGDSVYFQPFISYAFLKHNKSPAKIFEVRVSGAVNLSAQRELSYFSDTERIYNETMQWF